MAEFHFIKDPTTLSIIQAVLDLAGANFNAPYDSNQQPSDANSKNSDDLVQFQLPGGTSLRGYSEPSMTESMGSAINSMLSVLAPFISAYGLILPILGVIRGIIEILCAMMNPFAVVRAIIRLFKKWIPSFISIFPPLAGVIIIISLIKTILAVVLFILTVIVPTIQLIIYNIQLLAAAFGPDSNDAQRDAGRDKLSSLILELINQTGIMNTLLPLMDLIFLILGLVAGFPCGKGKKKKGKSDITNVTANFDELQDDTSCCDDEVCPPVLKNPPEGTAIMVPMIFADIPPLFTMKIITNDPRVNELKKYVQNFPEQLNSQLDEEVDVATPAGSNGDTALIRVEITSRRGEARKINVPVVKISGSDITIISPQARKMIGKVSYKIKPNYDLMVMYGIIGLGCHPDVEAAKDEVESKFPTINDSVIDKFPSLINLQNDFKNLIGDLNGIFNDLNVQVQDVIGKNPPYDDNIQAINAAQDNAVNLLTDFTNNLKLLLNNILANVADPFNSTFDVDKTIVRADGKDKATIIVIPRDATGSNLAQNLPNGVDIEVNLENNFGVVSNKRRDNSTGQILFDISSISSGDATIKAKINSNFVSIINDDGTTATKEILVKFVSDAILPTRRLITKPDPNTINISNSTLEKEPGD